MIYRERMMLAEDFKFNFRIYKVVHILWKLEAIDNTVLADHIIHLDNSRPVGIVIDYHKYTIFGGHDGIFQF